MFLFELGDAEMFASGSAFRYALNTPMQIRIQRTDAVGNSQA